jgi:hypothetical protein
MMTGPGAVEILSSAPRYVLWSLLGAAGLLIAFLVAYLPRLAVQPPLRQPGGSRVALAVGGNFAESDRFTGFVDENSGASVVVVELPKAAYEQLKRLGDTAEAFAAHGLADVKRAEIPRRKGEYLYLKGQQKTALVDYAKYVLIFPAQSETVMVTANIPQVALTSGAVTLAEIERIFQSACIKEEAGEARQVFALGYLGEFAEDVSLLGTTKAYKPRNCGFPGADGAGSRALFLVAPSLTLAPIPNLALFSEKSFHTIDQVRNKKVEAQRSLNVAGLNALEIVGSGADAASEEPWFVYQMVVEARHGGYFRLVGLAPEAERPRYLPEFRRIAESFEPSA